MKKHYSLTAGAFVCLAAFLTVGCGQHQSTLTREEQAQFGKYGQPMSPAVRAKYNAAMEAANKQHSAATTVPTVAQGQ